MAFNLFKTKEEGQNYDIKSLRVLYNAKAARAFKNVDNYSETVSQQFVYMFNPIFKVIDPYLNYFDPILYFRLVDFLGDKHIIYHIYKEYEKNSKQIAEYFGKDGNVDTNINQKTNITYSYTVNQDCNDVKCFLNVVIFKECLVFLMGRPYPKENITIPSIEQIIGQLPYYGLIGSVFTQNDVAMYSFVMSNLIDGAAVKVKR